MPTKVELICKAESITVAEVETPGDLSARSVVSGLRALDRARVPLPRSIQDGAQLLCRRCLGALFFRAADGRLFAANPGTVRAEA